MFEKIERYAENVATSAGQSRRGFLGRQVALGVAGVVGGLLFFPSKARAGFVEYRCPNGTLLVKSCPPEANIKHAGMICPLYVSRCGY
jgi:hypothetical protein